MADRPERDRLLMLAPAMPSDRGNGLAMRLGFFLDAYARRFDVDLVVAPFPGLGKSNAFANSRARRIEMLNVHRPDSHYALVASLIDPGPRLTAFRCYGRPSRTAFFRPLARSLDRLAKDASYKVVHVSRLYLAELVAPWFDSDLAGTRIVLDCDEDEALAFRRSALLLRRRHEFVCFRLGQRRSRGLRPLFLPMAAEVRSCVRRIRNGGEVVVGVWHPGHDRTKHRSLVPGMAATPSTPGTSFHHRVRGYHGIRAQRRRGDLVRCPGVAAA